MTRFPFLVLCCPTLGSLAGSSLLKIFSSSAGTYSLTFYSIAVSRPTEASPSFQATGYLNDQAFFHYDSESGKAEPLGPWRQVEGMEDWEKESKRQKARGDFILKNLEDIMSYYKDKGQWITDCRVRGSCEWKGVCRIEILPRPKEEPEAHLEIHRHFCITPPLLHRCFSSFPVAFPILTPRSQLSQEVMSVSPYPGTSDLSAPHPTCLRQIPL